MYIVVLLFRSRVLYALCCMFLGVNLLMSSLDTKQFLPSPYSPIFLTPFVIYHPNPKGHSNGQLYPLLRLMSGTIARFGTFEYQLERTRFIRHPKWLNGDLMYVNNISNRTRHLANRKSGRFSPYDTAPG